MEKKPKIKVVGIGGAGGNIVSFLKDSSLRGVELISINSDLQDLRRKKADQKIAIGYNLTQGLGTGMSPSLGRRCAESSQEEIKKALQDSSIVFLLLGEGGGTGTGAAPVIAKILEPETLKIGIVTTPFPFEGGLRQRVAKKGLSQLAKTVDALLVISNGQLLKVAGGQASVDEAFSLGNEVALKAIQGITGLVTSSGFISLDFAALRTFLKKAGLVFFGVGSARGPSRLNQAIYQALHSPLLDHPVEKARGALLNISSQGDLKINEFQKATKLIKEELKPGAELVFGTSVDSSLKGGWIRVTVILASQKAENS
jgi:cell division protein FtsZ